MIERLDLDATELRWCELRSMDELPVGEVGIPSDQVRQQRMRHLDGWSVGWTGTVIRVDNLATAAQLERAGFSDEARVWAARPGAVSEVPTPVPVLIIDVPDYPDGEGVSLVVMPDDAERFIAQIRDAIAEARHETKRTLKIEVGRAKDLLRERASKAEREALSCAIPDCRRPRVFFDEVGVGYCKRHAEERGVRPRGKVA